MQAALGSWLINWKCVALPRTSVPSTGDNCQTTWGRGDCLQDVREARLAIFSLRVWGPHRGLSNRLDAPARGGARVPSVCDSCQVARPLWLCSAPAEDWPVTLFAVTVIPGRRCRVFHAVFSINASGALLLPAGIRYHVFFVCSFTFLQRLLGRGRGLRGTGMPTGVRFGCWRRGPKRLGARLSSVPCWVLFSPRLNKLLLKM